MAKELNLDIKKIINYYSEGLSLKDIGDIFKVSSVTIQKRLIKNNIKIRSLSESHMISTKFKNAIKNRNYRGSNNPMYGKVTHGKVEFREDLGHIVRSSWEANFARILKYLKLKYEYEKHTFKLESNETYTPDFYVPKKDTFYEIKGFKRNDKFLRFKKEYPFIKLIIINERFYKKLLKIYSSKIEIQDNLKKFTKQSIILDYINYAESIDRYSSVVHFCQLKNISQKTILLIFNKFSNLKTEVKNEINKIEKNRLKNKYLEFFEKNKKFPTYLEFKKFYRRFSSLINKCYNNKYLVFIEDMNIKKG